MRGGEQTDLKRIIQSSMVKLQPIKEHPRRHIVLKAPSWWWGTSGVLVRQTGNDFWCLHVWNSQRGSTNGA